MDGLQELVDHQTIRQRIINKLLEAEQILRAQKTYFAVLLNKLESGKGEVLWKQEIL